MYKKRVMLTGVIFLGLIIAQQIWFPLINQRKPELTNRGSHPFKSQNEVNNLPEVVSDSKVIRPVALSNTKEGWGFRKNRDHRTPEITAHQKSLVDKYGIYFVANTDSRNKVVVLTFDLGYEKGYTKTILDILQKHRVKAIFFITGPWLKQNPDLARRMAEEGHIIGNHTWSHPSLPSVGRSEFEANIKKLEDAIVETTGQSRSIKYLRPPMGEYSEQTLQWTNELGYKTVFWSIALKDWMPMGGPDKAISGVMDNLHNGAIILLHGVSKDVTEGLDQILSQITANGYKIIPIDKIRPNR